mmetsp:Transcript_22752/g.37667  ORF Transcript_22752/g.37667 Transcript_22752/m.37667 type:complete len:238 (-) Transcript_22752:711-1424(-)
MVARATSPKRCAYFIHYTSQHQQPQEKREAMQCNYTVYIILASINICMRPIESLASPEGDEGGGRYEKSPAYACTSEHADQKPGGKPPELAVRRRLPPPMPPMPPMPPAIRNISIGSMCMPCWGPPPPPPLISSISCPLSYASFFFGSDKMSNASPISLNFFSAACFSSSVEAECRSGCHCRADLRYPFFISASEACFVTPRSLYKSFRSDFLSSILARRSDCAMFRSSGSICCASS